MDPEYPDADRRAILRGAAGATALTTLASQVSAAPGNDVPTEEDISTVVGLILLFTVAGKIPGAVITILSALLRVSQATIERQNEGNGVRISCYHHPVMPPLITPTYWSISSR